MFSKVEIFNYLLAYQWIKTNQTIDEIEKEELVKQSSTLAQVDPLELDKSSSETSGYHSPLKSPFRARVYKEEEEKGLYESVHSGNS